MDLDALSVRHNLCLSYPGLSRLSISVGDYSVQAYWVSFIVEVSLGARLK